MLTTTKRKLFVHLGMHKTGTTTIQRTLHDASDQLYIRDFLYPLAARHPREFRSHAMLPQLLGVQGPATGPMALFDEVDVDANLRSLKNEVDMSGRRNVIISSEDLWKAPKEGLDILSQIFCDFEIHPILFVRHPANFSLSFYSTMIRYGHIAQADISKMKEFWRWILNFDVLEIVKRWSAIAHSEKVTLVDYDRIQGGLLEVFFQIVGLPLNIPGVNLKRAENRSEAAAFLYLRQALLEEGREPVLVDRLIDQLSRIPITENQTLIPVDELEKMNRSYEAKCQEIRRSRLVLLPQPDAFLPPAPTAEPMYIGSLSGVFFAIGRALATERPL